MSLQVREAEDSPPPNTHHHDAPRLHRVATHTSPPPTHHAPHTAHLATTHTHHAPYTAHLATTHTTHHTPHTFWRFYPTHRGGVNGGTSDGARGRGREYPGAGGYTLCSGPCLQLVPLLLM